MNNITLGHPVKPTTTRGAAELFFYIYILLFLNEKV